MKFLILKASLFVLLCSNCVYSSNINNKQDSINQILRTTEDEFVKVNLMNELSRSYFATDFEKSIITAKEALNLAHLLDFNDGIIDAHRIIAYSYYYKGNYVKSLEHYFLALNRLKKISDKLKLAKTYSDIALVYNIIEKPQKAIFYSEKCLNILDKIKDPTTLVFCYTNFADSYSLLSNHSKEIEYLKKGINISKTNNLESSIGLKYNNLGAAYLKVNNFSEALLSYNFFLNTSKTLRDTAGIALSLNNIGYCYYSKGCYEAAISYYNKALSLKQNCSDYTYQELVKTYSKLGDVDKASHYFSLAINISSDFAGLSQSCEMLIALYKKKNDKGNTIKYLEKLNDLQKQINFNFNKDLELSIITKYQAEGMEARVYENEARVLLDENLALKSKINVFLILIFVLFVALSILAVSTYRAKLISEEKRLKDIKDSVLELGVCLDDLNSFRTKS